MAPPSITNYMDFRDFLRDWLAYQKREQPGYSYAAFAAAGGCSKATLANVLSGNRHPRPATLDAFARAMDLTPTERNVLRQLADLHAAPDVASRREALDRLLDNQRAGQVRHVDAPHDEDALRYVQHWYVPAIRELAALPGFHADPEWIVATLLPSLTVDEAQQALDLLFELDLLGLDEDGAVVVRELRFRTGAETQVKAADHTHREIVPFLLRTADIQNYQRQHLVSATITLSADQVAEAKQRLQAVLEQVATLADDRSEPGPRAVYQLSVQLIPVSEPVGAS